MGSEAPLALDYGWRKHEDLIDALPYVDPLTPEDKRAVEKLIEEEMRRSSKRPADYLRDLPPMPPSTIKEGTAIAAELERMARGEAMPKVDVTRYKLNPPPSSKRNDAGEWRKALENAYSQLGHQELRLMNLELQIKYGANVWRAYNHATDVVAKGFEQEVTELKQEIEETNRARKLQQVEADKEMRGVEARWIAAVHKNMEIEASCRQLEEQIAELKGSSTDGANGEPGAAAEGAPSAAAAAADGPEDGPQAMETG